MRRIIPWILLLLMLPGMALAGEGNMDGGGGGMGTGSSSNKWTPGHDGVRVCIVDLGSGSRVTKCVDYTNITPSSGLIHFEKKSKVDYNNGASLTPLVGNYHYKRPSKKMPRVITSNSKPASMKEVKKYWCSEYAAMMVCNDTGFSYTDLLSGNYKLLIEPIAFVTFQKKKVGFTATEAALYDIRLDGELRSRLPSTTHRNLPLAIFLEVGDLGYPAWTGSKSDKVSNDEILSSLGLGIVKYTEEPPDLPDPETEIETVNYEYRTDTDVISSIILHTENRITPDAPASVTFQIMGTNYTVNNIVIPAGGSQVVWCKWRTPLTPQTVTISVTATGAGASASKIKAKIVDLNENPPPNPTANDRNDSFVRAALPAKAEILSASWSVWYAYWVPNWEWVSNWVTDADGNSYDAGYWVDRGDWEYGGNSYSASFSASGTTRPDEKAVTASGQRMKSGYGVNIEAQGRLSTNAPSAHFTYAQNAVSYFPEFLYKTYWRLHDRVNIGGTSTLQLKENIYSTYNRRAHFTPVWYPDGDYTTHTWVLDAWTPVGMLSANVYDTITIEQSVIDDWHVAPAQ